MNKKLPCQKVLRKIRLLFVDRDWRTPRRRGPTSLYGLIRLQIDFLSSIWRLTLGQKLRPTSFPTLTLKNNNKILRKLQVYFLIIHLSSFMIMYLYDIC